jgi:membrane protein DedA with SNARE-associated domain
MNNPTSIRIALLLLGGSFFVIGFLYGKSMRTLLSDSPWLLLIVTILLLVLVIIGLRYWNKLNKKLQHDG